MTINDADFQRLVRFVRDTYGINLEHKRQLVDARLAFDISRRGYTGFTEYVAKVIGDPLGEECHHMMNRLSTNYTFFFREPDYVEQLCRIVLPDLLAQKRTHLRIWSAACSSGQEAYSVAMALSLWQQMDGGKWDFEIVGTDINTDMLQVAESGGYPIEELEQIPERYRQFVTYQAGGAIRMVEALRRKISWKYANLLDSEKECGGFDVVFCRNVMIYFTPQLRRDMTAGLHAALRPGGYLFTGTTESIDLERRYFRYKAPAFYQKA